MDKINKIKIKDVTYEIGGGGSATVDSGLSTTSENAVQNKVITSELEKKIDKSNLQTTINSVVAKYENIGGVHYSYDSSEFIQLQVEYTGATYTDKVTDKEQLCKVVGYTGDTSIPKADTGLYVIFKASDLEYLKNTFPNRTFNVNVCNVPSDGYQTHELYNIYQDIGSGKAMRGKQYVMEMDSNMGYSSTNILEWNNPRAEFDVTFESLYAKYSGDTSTMFYAYWGHIRNAFYGYSPSCEINGDSNSHTVYIYSSSKVSYYTMNGEMKGFYVKFIEKSDFNGNVTIDLQHSMDYMYGAADLASMKTDIASNKTKIDSLETKVVYAEPDTSSSAHTFTRTINGEKLYTADNANRDIKLVTSVNGKTGAVNIQAKTINGESVLGEGEIDMSSYQTKTEAVKIARLTQAEYDALSTKDNNTLYIITDAQ